MTVADTVSTDTAEDAAQIEDALAVTDPASAGSHVDPQTAAAGGFVPEQSRAERRTGFDVADFPVPTGREEDWRFTPVRRLKTLLAGEATGQVEQQLDLPGEATSSVLTLDEARELGILPPQDRAAVVAAAGSAEVLLLDVPAEAELDGPVRLRLTGTGAEAAYAHVVVRAGRFSKATVVVEHSGTGALSELVSVVTGDGSDLTVVSTQRWDDDGVHLAQHDALVGRDARYRHLSVSLGGQVVRVNANVRYAGPGGDATLLGVYFADAGQHLEHRSYIDHNAAHCKSLVTYKGALQGETARTVWVGDVLIRAEAEGTDTYELNRNLVLTDGARADSVPNLEIETGEIEGAGHASATGRFDDLQLFYLQSRGITEEEAKRLVVRGFFADIVREIPLSDLRDEITAAIEEELASTAYAAPTQQTPSTTEENRA
ncbi:iron-regulated ABC transporter permease protein SufD [Terracoccus luteus]|uniref:Iron-regulated ABC transporter permease protein SufD n=1 Tax=Terracoccus luteus TaxID=53356 RepID=A0A495Y035_9MICO|nr:Fe-S cluster assembly protein SufD [Terracoccus luteus]RKT78113.1 iron-regulated ABC transporter permease protein SufD [Terracoccus luteus]